MDEPHIDVVLDSLATGMRIQRCCAEALTGQACNHISRRQDIPPDSYNQDPNEERWYCNCCGEGKWSRLESIFDCEGRRLNGRHA